MMNRFANSLFFVDNQEFTVATKPEQEKIILCRRFIQNAIVLWNYGTGHPAVFIRITNKSGICGCNGGNDKRHP